MRPTLLIILDGFGEREEKTFNAIALARTPTLDRLRKTYAKGELEASQSFVGLPKGFMGNSEVGHLNIGAGRVVYQDFSLISREIETGGFFRNRVFLDLIGKVKTQRSRLHLMGLVSDGGVHSHISHLFALLELSKREGLADVWVHAITDGRDTDPRQGAQFALRVEARCRELGVGKVATVSGRFFAMDRDKRWDRTERAYRCIAEGLGERFEAASDFVNHSYEVTGDEFIVPGAWGEYPGVKKGDGFIFFNFRADRARQITRALAVDPFDGFSRQRPDLSGFVCMTPYDVTFGLPFAYEKTEISDTLGEIVSKRGWKQLRIAETEKYAHVTYFFSGGREREFPLETRVLVPSPRDVKTYDLRPEMSAREVTRRLLEELPHGYALAVINFANPDMVGHTGNLPAAIQAIEVVDECLGKIIDWVERQGAMAIVTSDHGNCEEMALPGGKILTAHTLLRVPLIVIDPKRKIEITGSGSLCDIAPTILSLWGARPPKLMTGRSLVRVTG